jgi:excisionase family DNA binding protein
MEKLFNVNEVAEHLGITVQTVRRYMAAKKIPYHKIDRMVRFVPAEIHQWVIKNEAAKIGKKNQNTGSGE